MRLLTPQLYLWLAILIFGAANSVTQKLTRLGMAHQINGHNPISLCNVLFVGNLCALLVFIPIYGKQWRWQNLKQLTRKQWGFMGAVAILAGALAPGLIFQALALTSVNNVILIGRLEPPLTLVLSIWLLREQVHPRQLLGAIVALIGVFLILILQPAQPGMMTVGKYFSLGWGDVATALAAIALATSTILGKMGLAQVPLGIFTIFRTALGTVIFATLALLLYGNHHFKEALSPFLWQWMLVYGPIVVVAGQSFWIRGLRGSTISTATLISCFYPIAALLSAYLILAEVPTPAQLTGGGVILIGILLSQKKGRDKANATAEPSKMNLEKVQELENAMGFKGI